MGFVLVGVLAYRVAWAASPIAHPLPATTAASGAPPSDAAGPATSDADSYAPVRNAFRAAYERAIAGESDSSDDSASLRAYPLYPYLIAARIREALNGSPETLALVDERAAVFIAAHSREPVVHGLRRAWLDSLARRGRWDLFLQAYDGRAANDELRCESLDARIAHAEPGDAPRARIDTLTRDVERLWLLPLNVPECEPAFEWLRRTGVLTLELIEQRARLELAQGNSAVARASALQLPPAQATPLFQWISLLESPRRSIDDLIASPDQPVEPAALLAGWSRVAREDPDAALARYESLVRARGLSPQSASPYALALALALARDRNPAALDYFKRVRPDDLDDVAIAWRVRAALWSGDWAQADESLAALSDKERELPGWRYWAARSAEQLGRSTEARRTYESLLADDDYYSAMAAARLHRPVVPHPQALPVDRETLAALERVPALVRARELFLCGLRSEASAEWQLGYQSLAPPGRLQAIQLAASWGWYDQSVAAATAERVFNDYTLLYPRPYDASVSAAAELSGLSPDLIYGVVRQESLYRTDAVSRAGARGLMQLEPGTARITARYWNRQRPLPSELFDPDINMSLGAARLRMLIDRFEGQLPVALAGYDAGINAVGRWLPSRPMDADVWIENIPYSETRGYVQHVLWNSLLFSWLRSGRAPQHADAWLSAIETPTRGPNVASVGIRTKRK